MVNQAEIFTKRENETLSSEQGINGTASSNEILGMSPFAFGVVLTTATALTEACNKSLLILLFFIDPIEGYS